MQSQRVEDCCQLDKVFHGIIRLSAYEQVVTVADITSRGNVVVQNVIISP